MAGSLELEITKMDYGPLARIIQYNTFILLNKNRTNESYKIRLFMTDRRS